MRPRSSVLIFAVFLLATWAVAATGAPKPRAEEQLSFGVAMAKRGLWNEALFRFRMANQANPNDSRILNNMAVAFEAVGRFEEALASYQRALKADPTSRELKKNYSRFIEFYQGFKPPDESEEEDRSESEVADSARQP